MLILRQGKSCELSLIFLEVMDELRMRQPNYHARVHGNAPETYLNKIFDILSRGSNSPALYNDDVIVPTMVRNGYSPDDAQDYTGVGCVEPVCQGKSFASTDAAYHPTPFTSMLLDGCLQKGICSTAGGATYNFSGIQAVGPVDTGDALYAIKQAVFEEKRLSLPGLIRLLKDNLTDGKWRVYLCGLAKFGNDNEEVDAYTMYVINTFQDCLNGRTNTRGETGRTAIQNLFKTYFRRGGMQVQLNVIDPSVLREARDNPDAYPHLLVRVSGYSAYFNDLTPKMKDEIIQRTSVPLQ
jgi:pyruvate-formate lyase